MSNTCLSWEYFAYKWKEKERQRERGSESATRKKSEKERKNTRYYFSITTRFKPIAYRWCCSITLEEKTPRERERERKGARKEKGEGDACAEGWMCVSLTCFVRSALRRPYVCPYDYSLNFCTVQESTSEKSSENRRKRKFFFSSREHDGQGWWRFCLAV